MRPSCGSRVTFEHCTEAAELAEQQLICAWEEALALRRQARITAAPRADHGWDWSGPGLPTPVHLSELETHAAVRVDFGGHCYPASAAAAAEDPDGSAADRSPTGGRGAARDAAAQATPGAGSGAEEEAEEALEAAEEAASRYTP